MGNIFASSSKGQHVGTTDVDAGDFDDKLVNGDERKQPPYTKGHYHSTNENHGKFKFYKDNTYSYEGVWGKCKGTYTSNIGYKHADDGDLTVEEFKDKYTLELTPPSGPEKKIGPLDNNGFTISYIVGKSGTLAHSEFKYSSPIIEDID